MKPPLAQGHVNDFQTPPQALIPLFPYLKKDWIVWECATGKRNLELALIEKGYEVIGTDIMYGQDFLTMNIPEIDCIITNPPFSLKQQFLQKCYKLGKPLALLLPLTTFETAKRQALFKKYGLEVIFFDKRINFETPSGQGSGSWFATAWFCHKLELPSQLNCFNGKNLIPIPHD